MNSLNEHLRAGAFHDGLPFHPSCPICRRERLYGDLEIAPLMPVRTQAAILAGVVAASGAMPPAAALAVEADRTTDGTASVTQAPPADPAANSDFDPGGGDTSLPEEPPAPQPAAPAADASADGAVPVDPPTAADEADPVTDAVDVPQAEPSAPPAEPATAPSADPSASTAPAVPAPSPAPASEPAQSPSTDATDREPATAPHAKPRRQQKQTSRRAASTQVDVAPAAAPAPPESAAQPAVATPVAVAAEPSGASVSVSGSVHVVKPGESLWAIADAVLGGDASTAQIAREVNRLWSLNSARIGTGDRDLLAVGTRLVLR